MPHVQVAVNERAFNKLVYGAANALSHVAPVHFNGSLGPFSLDLLVGFKLIPGNIVDLTSSGTVVINKLEIVYDPLVITFGIDIGPVVIPPYCVDLGPFSFCTPEIPIIPTTVHIPVPIDLSGLVVSSYSGEFSLHSSLQTLAARAGMGNHRAHATTDTTNEIQTHILSVLQTAAFISLLPTSTLTSIAGQLATLVKSNLADKQQFFLHEIRQNINLIDIGETVKNILNGIVDKVLDAIFGWVPSSLRDIAKAILSPVIDAIGFVLDLPSDLTWWLEGLLGTNLGLLNTVTGFIEQLLGAIVPVYQFENPYPVIEDSSGLIPVLIGVEKLSTVIDDNEFVLSANISNS